MRRLRAGANVAPRTREAPGIRPGPLRGSATCAGWTGTGERREIAVLRPERPPRPRKNGPGQKIAAVERREALPCAAVSRRSGKHAAAVTKLRLSALPPPSPDGERGPRTS